MPPWQWHTDQVLALRSGLMRLRAARQATELEGLVPSSLEQIYTARSAFKDDANNYVLVVLSMYAGGGALLVAATGTNGGAGAVLLSALSALVFGPVVRKYSDLFRNKLEVGYDLYVAASLYATLVFKALRLESTLQSGSSASDSAVRTYPMYPHAWLQGSQGTERNTQRLGVFLFRPRPHAVPDDYVVGRVFVPLDGVLQTILDGGATISVCWSCDLEPHVRDVPGVLQSRTREQFEADWSALKSSYEKMRKAVPGPAKDLSHLWDLCARNGSDPSAPFWASISPFLAQDPEDLTAVWKAAKRTLFQQYLTSIRLAKAMGLIGALLASAYGIYRMAFAES